MTRSFLIPALVAGLIVPASSAPPPRIDVGPAPAWVKPVAVPHETTSTHEAAGNFYLLVDRQDNVARNAWYYHDVRKITSETGVQKGAALSASFNPAYEKIIFHTIRVIRNGVSSDRLDRSRLEITPTETDPQRQIYHPYFTVQTTLDDVRVGDLVEFAYTTEGANPLRQGRWLVVLYHPDCDSCRAAIPLYAALATATEAAAERDQTKPRIAFVAMPPVVTPADDPVVPSTAYLHLNLKPDHDWFATTPVVAAIDDGRVIFAAEGEQAVQPPTIAAWR